MFVQIDDVLGTKTVLEGGNVTTLEFIFNFGQFTVPMYIYIQSFILIIPSVSTFLLKFVVRINVYLWAFPSHPFDCRLLLF